MENRDWPLSECSCVQASDNRVIEVLCAATQKTATAQEAGTNPALQLLALISLSPLTRPHCTIPNQGGSAAVQEPHACYLPS